MASGDTKTEAMLRILGNGGSADAYRGCCNTKTQSYILDAVDRVQGLEDELNEFRNNPDVVDIVDTYQDLENYDTSTLTDKDIIRVLEDSTHNYNSTYYRWNAQAEQFDFIGEISGWVVGAGTSGSSNTTFRGANLSEKYTDAELSAKVQAGDFSDIYIGDYITKTVKVGNNTAREEDFVVAGVDYFLGTGDTELTEHHLVLIPKNGFFELMKMNDANTTTGGYYGSQAHGIASTEYTAGTGGALTNVVADYEMFLRSTLEPTDGTYTFTRNSSGKWELNSEDVGADLNAYGITYTGTPVEGDTIVVTFAKGYLEPYRQAIYAAFGEVHILNHREFMTTSTSTGAWHDARIELMNESMAYGQRIRANNVVGEMFAKDQLPLFRNEPSSAIAHRGKGGPRYNAWWSSTSSASTFCSIYHNGIASASYASDAYVVRPYFLFT